MQNVGINALNIRCNLSCDDNFKFCCKIAVENSTVIRGKMSKLNFGTPTLQYGMLYNTKQKGGRRGCVFSQICKCCPRATRNLAMSLSLACDRLLISTLNLRLFAFVHQFHKKQNST